MLTAWSTPQITLKHSSNIHTADYWLHIYTPMRLCLQIHANFGAVIIMLHVQTNSDLPCVCTSWCKQRLVFDMYTSTVSVSVPKCRNWFPVPSLCPTFTCATTFVLKQNIDDYMSVLVHTLCEVIGGDEMSPSTHLRAGHLASHLKKKNKTSLSNMTRFEISCCMSLMHSLRTLTYFVEH